MPNIDNFLWIENDKEEDDDGDADENDLDEDNADTAYDDVGS